MIRIVNRRLLVTRMLVSCPVGIFGECGTPTAAVENLGGRVAIDSIIDSGTTVIIDLPI
jgi:hypothetical protein